MPSDNLRVNVSFPAALLSKYEFIPTRDTRIFLGSVTFCSNGKVISISDLQDQLAQNGLRLTEVYKVRDVNGLFLIFVFSSSETMEADPEAVKLYNDLSSHRLWQVSIYHNGGSTFWINNSRGVAVDENLTPDSQAEGFVVLAGNEPQIVL